MKSKTKPETNAEKRNKGIVPFVKTLYLNDPANWVMVSEKKNQIYSSILRRQLLKKELEDIEVIYNRLLSENKEINAEELIHEMNLIFIDYLAKEDFEDNFKEFESLSKSNKSRTCYAIEKRDGEIIFYEEVHKNIQDNKEYELMGVYMNNPLYKKKSIKDKIRLFNRTIKTKDLLDYFKVTTTRDSAKYDKLTEMIVNEMYKAEMKKVDGDKDQLRNIRFDKVTHQYGIIVGDVIDNKYLFVDLNYSMNIRMKDLSTDMYNPIDDAPEIKTKTGMRGYHYIYPHR